MTDETINAEQCAELLYCTEQRIEELTRTGEGSVRISVCEAVESVTQS